MGGVGGTYPNSKCLLWLLCGVLCGVLRVFFCCVLLLLLGAVRPGVYPCILFVLFGVLAGYCSGKRLRVLGFGVRALAPSASRVLRSTLSGVFLFEEGGVPIRFDSLLTKDSANLKLCAVSG